MAGILNPITSEGGFATTGNIIVKATNADIVMGDATPTGSPGLSSTSSLTIVADRTASSAPQWSFNTSGTFSTPGDINAVGNIITNSINIAQDGNTYLSLDRFGITANTQMVLSAANGTTGNNSSILFDKNGNGIVLRLEDTTPTQVYWGFYHDNLLFPDGSRQYHAFTGAANTVNATGNIDANNYNITNLAQPVNSTDAATKQYVDDNSQGLNVHDPANAATTTTLASTTGGTVTYDNGADGVGATLTISGATLTTIDGVSLSTNMRILVKNEANATWNGVYIYNSDTQLTRSSDFDDSMTEISGGDYIFVEEGTTNAKTSWVQSTLNVMVGVDPIVFYQFSAAGTYNAGTGLTLTGSTFSVNSTQTQITQVGTLSSLSVSGTLSAGNISGNIGGNGGNLSNINGSNVTGQVSYAAVANSVSVANVSGIGNIATINLDGSLSNVLYGNGVFAPQTSDVANANYANYAGNVVISAQGNITSLGNLVNIQLDSTVTPITANAGQMFWDTVEQTMTLGMNNGVQQQVGLESYIIVKASSTITNGQVVMFTGANGDNVLGAPADTTSVGFKTDYIIGVATQDIATNNFGYITTFGKVHGLNTNSFNLGDILWLDNSTPGLLTNIQPSDPNYQIQIAAVTKKSSGDGHIQVRLTPYWSLSKLTDVTITSPLSGQSLVYNGSVWINGIANISNIAYSVSGANVTGAVSYATVANSVAVANVSGLGNIATINLNGSSSQILYGNGVFAAAPASYTNTNATSLLASFGSNTISTTGNVNVGNLIAATDVIATGNVWANAGSLRTTASTANVFNATPTTVNIAGGASLAVNIGNTSGTINLSGNVQGNTNGFAIGYRDIPQLSFAGNTTVALSDAGKHYYSTLSTANTLTVPNNSSVAFATGTAINIINQGTGTITIAQGTGVTIYLAGNSTSGNRTLSSYGMATLQKVATDTWFLVGVGLT